VADGPKTLPQNARGTRRKCGDDDPIQTIQAVWTTPLIPSSYEGAWPSIFPQTIAPTRAFPTSGFSSLPFPDYGRRGATLPQVYAFIESCCIPPFSDTTTST